MRVKISRAVNYYLFNGKKGHMLSTRAYIEHRQRTQFFIDWMFFILRGEIGHCRNSMLHDLGGEHETEKEAEQGTSQTPQK